MTTTTAAYGHFAYPRRRVIRAALKRLTYSIFAVLTDFKITGQENLPEGGPLLVIANHFSFVDPVVMIRSVPWPLEFIGGFELPNSPPVVRGLPKLWGYYPVFRGTGSRYALRAAEAVLAQDGVLGIYPEAGSWATVLRPARPGTAFLASRTGARLLPLGFDGVTDIFPALRRGMRAKVRVRIGKPFGPFRAEGRGRDRRRQLDEFGHEMMSRIARLLPPERRGHYSEDPAIREAARGTELYPWDDEVEGA
jgi:1-acyl-sn-glycerol-3-phosphate acyltransferase